MDGRVNNINEFTVIFCALLYISISIPLVLQKISMNPYYGIRIAKAYESEANWYHINRYRGKWIIIWSFPILLIGLVGLSFPLEPDNRYLYLLSIFIVFVPLIQTIIWSRKL